MGEIISKHAGPGALSSPAGTGSVRPEAGPVLEVRGLTKSFFGIPVLEDAALKLHAGEVHGLVGENGAGKSTLMKVLAGVYQRDAGTILLDGKEVHFSHPTQAHEAGLSTVFQEFNLLPDRTVAENIYLGREPRKGMLVNKARMNATTAELLESLGITSIKPTTAVRSLSVAEQQIVEIAKAISYDARIISMDEPTAALAGPEVELLYQIVRRLQERGTAILYVSHRLREIFDLCDTITVLKDGRIVDTRPAAELDDASLVRLMVGRPISAYFPDKLPRDDADEPLTETPLLALDNAGNDQLDGISLSIAPGEIVGVAGLQGSGRTELVQGIFGAAPFTRGTMRLDGTELLPKSPRQAIRARIALITEDRKAEGLSLNQSILDNALGVIRSVFPRSTGAVKQDIPGVFSALEVIARDLDQEVQYLSGGNQQKVVLAKWLAISPRVVLLDEPTRGIDVGAKIAVYRLMRQLAAEDKAVLMVSSELPEVIGMSDRIIVMRDGRIAGELPAGATEEQILQLGTGARPAANSTTNDDGAGAAGSIQPEASNGTGERA
ncbi:sugar ABC transporter ATP-binding protein [Arthrobacter crystallopoietes]|uniref:Monosaccharide ABC transporter ATP-binding protein, CUT2 family n=1 Tax=Crystallibacter crystallopoietes TaxID=37928 RepID=A0A1H1CAA8_9MICC|nr:sugar ABC transporter ATP-binding protein [Arthrobacter crystallopoietes]AUI50814.1 sugar ABC transporter ATP-binding protein [Arthrobacter crystallopoietes]SDQ61131.1 monosaccharide ABC transporter ATP-binding protein, CUT2 family [Arthrobacter crystallopoietes]